MVGKRTLASTLLLARDTDLQEHQEEAISVVDNVGGLRRLYITQPARPKSQLTTRE